jgi:ribose 5-phosphate isomerase B
MRIAFGTDEPTELTTAWIGALRAMGHEVTIVADGDSWPDVGHRVGAAVATGVAERGVVCCTTGTGVAIAANKIPGVRAALCPDASTAMSARRWNDANVLAIGLRLTSLAVGIELLSAFCDTPADPDEADQVARVELG